MEQALLMSFMFVCVYMCICVCVTVKQNSIASVSALHVVQKFAIQEKTPNVSTPSVCVCMCVRVISKIALSLIPLSLCHLILSLPVLTVDYKQ